MEILGNTAGNTVEGHSQGLRLHFHSHGCRVRLGTDCVLAGLTVHVRSPDCILEIGDRSIARGDIHMKSPGARVSIGSNLRARTGLFMNVTGGFVSIGDDCLFANVKFRTSDSHTLMDAASGEVLNPPGNIEVGDRVWLAEDVLLLRNARVGADSAVGARSIVNGEIPPASLAVGTPARVVRQGIRWKE